MSLPLLTERNDSKTAASLMPTSALETAWESWGTLKLNRFRSVLCRWLIGLSLFQAAQLAFGSSNLSGLCSCRSYLCLFQAAGLVQERLSAVFTIFIYLGWRGPVSLLSFRDFLKLL